MKRLLCLVLILSLLCGCGLLQENTYIMVEPHDEDYEMSLDSDAVTVSSGLALKNAILYFVEEGVENGVIRTEAYSGNLTEDLEQAVYEASKLSPLGAFSVESMTYDYSRIVSYYEIHIHTTFSRTPEDVDTVGYADNTEAVTDAVAGALEQYAPRLLLRVGNYEEFDIEEVVYQLYLDHPEFVLEKPEVTMETYPKDGPQRILEIQFQYKTDAAELAEMNSQLKEKAELLSSIYGTAYNDITDAKRFYNRLGRDAVCVPKVEDLSFFTDGAYGALLDNCATCYGFAQAYLLLLRGCDIEGQLISGVRAGESHYWCLVKLDGNYYYVDPSRACEDYDTDYFLMGDTELEAGGYYTWMYSELPEATLPDHLKPLA